MIDGRQRLWRIEETRLRFYKPRKEILDGTWTFPKVTPVKPE
jgi:hypothetical protein